MESSAAFDQLLSDVDEFYSSFEDLIGIQERELRAASKSADSDREAEARRGVKLTMGAMEVLGAIRATAMEARDVQRLPFGRMVGALESSYLTLELALGRQQQVQQAAFTAALHGGSRSAYDRETDELNLASGRFDEVTRWLHRARAIED